MSGLNYNGASFSKRKVRRSFSGIRGKKSKDFLDKKMLWSKVKKKKNNCLAFHSVHKWNIRDIKICDGDVNKNATSIKFALSQVFRDYLILFTSSC